MPSSFTSLTYHIVFGTKYRRNLISPAVQPELYGYMAGIIANKNGQSLEIGGMSDHVHILAHCHPGVALSDFIRDIKANSSRWVRGEGGASAFAWQVGYAAFTESRSQTDAIRHYVRHQPEHHRRHTFEEEYKALLRRHGIALDEQKLFEGEHNG